MMILGCEMGVPPFKETPCLSLQIDLQTQQMWVIEVRTTQQQGGLQRGASKMLSRGRSAGSVTPDSGVVKGEVIQVREKDTV